MIEDPAKVHGEEEIQLTPGTISFKHQMSVTDIEDEINISIMNSKGFQLNFKKGALTVNDEEVIVHGKNWDWCVYY